jgi:serine/threonine-protein kinase SRPK3
VVLNRYVIVKLIGRGAYSTCWLARDCKLELYVALKVFRGAPYYREIAIQEFDRHFLLNKLRLEAAKSGDRPCPVVRLFDMFQLNGWIGSHVCLVFELLSHSLAHLLDFYRDEIVVSAEQASLAALHTTHSCIVRAVAGLHLAGLIHTDIKAANFRVSLPPLITVLPAHRRRSSSRPSWRRTACCTSTC